MAGQSGFDEGRHTRVCGSRGSEEPANHQSSKKGDVLLVPRLPSWERVAIVEAVEDFDAGYTFKIDTVLKDYGHCFPARATGSFARSSGVVSGDIRTTLRYQGRFWNIDVYREEIENILNSDETARTRPQQPTDGLHIAVQQAFNKLGEDLFEKLQQQNEGKDWETILTEVLEAIYPNYGIELVGGHSESEHGTDILISIPGVGGDAEGGPENDYAIAIQVKDQTSLTAQAIEQIQRAPSYWKKARGFRFVDKCVVLTKAEEKAPEVTSEDTKIVWADDLRKIIEAYARCATPISHHRRLGE